jgi:GTP pyrophosphokinase
MLTVSWARTEPAVRVVEICVEAWDRPKLVRDITTVLGDQHVNLLSATFSSDEEHLSKSRFIFEVGSTDHLAQILRELKKVGSVIDAYDVGAEEETAP